MSDIESLITGILVEISLGAIEIMDANKVSPLAAALAATLTLQRIETLATSALEEAERIAGHNDRFFPQRAAKT